MSIAQSLLPEFDIEMAATRAVLERVPADRMDWRPHERSFTLGELATHVARLPEWTVATLAHDSFDLEGAESAAGGEVAADPAARLDETASAARQALLDAEDDAFMGMWTLQRGGEEIFSAPKIGVLRRFVLNHMIHHRGQLTVYLRLLDVPVPQTFGPTADEPDFN